MTKRNATGDTVHGSLNDISSSSRPAHFGSKARALAGSKPARRATTILRAPGPRTRPAFWWKCWKSSPPATGRTPSRTSTALSFSIRVSACRPIEGRSTIRTPARSLSRGSASRTCSEPKGEHSNRRSALLPRNSAKCSASPTSPPGPRTSARKGSVAWCVMSNPLTDAGPNASIRLVQGEARLDQARDHRSDRQAKVAPRSDRGLAAGVFQGPGPRRRLEYFLLENRRKTGFDHGLPAEELLIWRVVNDRPILEESHGVEGPTGPTVHH